MAAANAKASELVVASNGGVSIAPYGSALPVDSRSAPAAAFNDLGYLTEAGVTLTATPSVTDIGAWQKLGPVRKITTGRALTAAGVLLQLNQATLAAALGGGKFTMVTPGAYRYDPPLAGDALKEYSVVIDAQDGATAVRYVIRRAVISGAVTMTFLATGAVTLPIEFDALEVDDPTLAPWYMLSDAVEFSIAS